MKENRKEWPERLEEIMRTVFCSLQSYGRQCRQYVIKYKMWIPFDATIPLLNISHEEIIISVHASYCNMMLVAACL